MESENDSPASNSDNSEQNDQIKVARTPKSFKPTKLIGFPTEEIEIQFKDKDKRVIGYWKTKKHRKDDNYFVKILPKGKKKNPDKKTYASVGKFPYASQIYTYANNDTYVYITHGADSIQLSTEDFFSLLVQTIQMVDIDQDVKDKVIMTSLALQLRKYKRPFLKVGLDKIKEFKLEDVVDEFIKDSKDKEKVWD